MLHHVRINRRTDLASAPYEIEINGAPINLHDKLPTEHQVEQAIERYDVLTSSVEEVNIHLGISPASLAKSLLEQFNALPANERAIGAAAFVQSLIDNPNRQPN